MKKLTCEQCGGQLTVDEDKDFATCSYCKTKYKISDDKVIIIQNGSRKLRATPMTPEQQKEFDKTMSKMWVGIAIVPIIIFITIIFLVIRISNKSTKQTNEIKSNNAVLEKEKQERDKFNSQFSSYLSNSYSKDDKSVTELLDKVIESNKANDKHIITIVFGEKSTSKDVEIEEIKKLINDECHYSVTSEKDENSYINKITIKEQDIVSKFSFNSSYESHNGRQPCLFLDSVFNNTVTNNKKSKRHIVTMEYKGQKYSTPESITNLRKLICPNGGQGKYYEISYDYDSNGYINVMHIK